MSLTKKHALLVWIVVGPVLFSIAQPQPPDLTGLIFWLRADEGVFPAQQSNVAQWMDMSGQDHHALQAFATLQPILLSNQINGLPAVSFDGTDDFMEFPEVNSIRTAFWVVRENPASHPDWPRRSLLGHHESMYFLRGDGRRIWDPFASQEVISGTTRLNFETVNGTQSPLPDGFNLVSLVTTGMVKASNLTMDLNIYGRTWWGEIAEIIAYDQPLEPDDVLAVEEYLANKYTPHFPEIDDIVVPYGFCSFEVCAPEGMASYLWSDGSVTPCISIEAGGSYSVEVTDQFGRTFSESFTVQFPGTLPAAENILCAGQQWSWNLALEEEDYTFSWNNDGETAAWTTSQGGDYQLIVTDSLGCSMSHAFSLTEDPFPLLQWLQTEYDLCAGNTMEILPAADYLFAEWSTGETGPSIVITDSGEYEVTLQNEAGCTASNTTSVTVAGTAPLIQIESSGFCTGSEIAFTAIGTSALTGHSWQFGDVEVPGEATVSYTWSTPGVYPVHVQATDDTGCAGSATIGITIIPSPSPAVQYSNPCVATPTEFWLVPDQDLSTTEWSFGDQVFLGESTFITFEEAGEQQIALFTMGVNGCPAQMNFSIDAKPAPEVSISHEGGCFGELVQFVSQTEVPVGLVIQSRQWHFGDGNSSPIQNPLHFFSQPGNYSVSFSATLSNGCSAAVTSNVSIVLPPAVDFITGNACVNQPFQLVPDIITQPGDGVISFSWMVNGQQHAVTSQAEVTFSEPGLSPVSLFIETQSGCTADITQQIPVWPVPEADFRAYPLTDSEELTWEFENLSTGSNLLFEWSFGNEQTSTQPSPQIVFEGAQEMLVTLRATSLQGCQHSVSRMVDIAYPLLDLITTEVRLTPHGSGLFRVEAEVHNGGNVQVNRIEANWQGGGELVITQDWQTDLWPGEVIQLVFEGAINPATFALDYFCVQAYAPDLAMPDAHPDDNVRCLALSAGGLQLYPPFPNPGDTHFFLRCVTPGQGDVEIRIVDSTGRIVKLLGDFQVKSGFHQYLIDIRDLSDGAYVIVLVAGGQQRSARFNKGRL